MKILTKKCIVCGKKLTKQWQKKFCSRHCYYKWEKENPNKGWRKKGNKLGFQKWHRVFGGLKTRFQKGQKAWNKGKHLKFNNALEKWRKSGGQSWNKGKHIKTNDALSKWRKKGNAISGKRHWNWKGGTSKMRERIEAMPEYKRWRNAVFKRDNWICQKCKKRGRRIHPHHKMELSIILAKYRIRTLRDARQCKKLWDTNNGKTLCIPCHKQTRSYLKNDIR
jgi:hypothetical protein